MLSLLHSKSEIISVVSRYIAIDRYIEKYKEEYYFVLSRCSEGKFKENPEDYKIQYFLEFMLKILKESIGGIAIYRKKFQSEQKLSNAASVILACFKEYPEIRLTTLKLLKARVFQDVL